MKFNSTHIAFAEQKFHPVIDTCDIGHKFAKLPDHPLRNGNPRCPICMATGLDAARNEIESLERQIESLVK